MLVSLSDPAMPQGWVAVYPCHAAEHVLYLPRAIFRPEVPCLGVALCGCGRGSKFQELLTPLGAALPHRAHVVAH